MPAGPEALPREARSAVDEYLAELDAALPRIARGIYVTGSAGCDLIDAVVNDAAAMR